jgi:hypothetical protein
LHGVFLSALFGHEKSAPGKSPGALFVFVGLNKRGWPCPAPTLHRILQVFSHSPNFFPWIW